jgi:hypothetical protein
MQYALLNEIDTKLTSLISEQRFLKLQWNGLKEITEEEDTTDLSRKSIIDEINAPLQMLYAKYIPDEDSANVRIHNNENMRSIIKQYIESLLYGTVYPGNDVFENRRIDTVFDNRPQLIQDCKQYIKELKSAISIKIKYLNDKKRREKQRKFDEQRILTTAFEGLIIKFPNLNEDKFNQMISSL